MAVLGAAMVAGVSGCGPPADVEALVEAEAAAESDAERERLRREILDRLGDADFETRERTTAALIVAGPPILPWLIRARATESDAEIQARLTAILEIVGVADIAALIEVLDQLTTGIVFREGAEQPDTGEAVARLEAAIRELNARLGREDIQPSRRGLLEEAIELLDALKEELADPDGDPEGTMERARERLGQAIDRRFGDLDGDGLPAEWEVRLGLDPTAPDTGDSDFDGDGTSDRAEIERGTDPCRR